MTDQQNKPTIKGGTKDFNWNDVRYMSYKDRESYLGYTVKIGFLDKGGKWRKRDWWKNSNKKRNKDLSSITQDPEFIRQKEKDERRMRIALGLEEKEEEFELPKMTGEDARYLTQKIKAEAEQEWEDEQVEKMPGLGMKGSNYNLSKEKSKRVLLDEAKALRLEGYGIDDGEEGDQERADKAPLEASKKDRKGGLRDGGNGDEGEGEGIKKGIKKEKRDKKKKRKGKKDKKGKKSSKEAKKKKSKEDRIRGMYRL